MENGESSPPVAVVEQRAGVDWVRILAAPGREARTVEGWAVEVGHADERFSSGVRPWRFMGYEGWQTNRVRVGHRKGAACMEVSGAASASLLSDMLSLPGRVSRLDVQTTVLLSASLPSFGTRFLRRAGTTRSLLPQHRPKVGRSTDSTGLYLGTVGRRTSPRYMRVYDKGIESGTQSLGRLWRVEVEAKYGLAEELWNDLRKAEDVATWCSATCKAQWQSSGYCWPSLVKCEKHDALRAPEKPPVTATQLAAWLRQTVAPTIPRLREVYSRAEILRMLGLDDDTTAIGGSDDSSE